MDMMFNRNGIEAKNHIQEDATNAQKNLQHTEEDLTPSLTYDSDDLEEEKEDREVAMMASRLAASSTNLDVRKRADSWAYQEKAGVETGVELPPQINHGIDKLRVGKPRMKHEIRILSLERPRVPKGGDLSSLLQPNQDFKLPYLMGMK